MSLYYNDKKDYTENDYAREIMYLCRKIRMMSPSEYKTEGQHLMIEIQHITRECIGKYLLELRDRFKGE